MIRGDAADFFNLRLGDRLLICDDGKRLQHHLAEHLLLRRSRHPDQILVILCPCGHLIGILKLNDLHPPVFPAVALFKAFHHTLRHLLALVDGDRELP